MGKYRYHILMHSIIFLWGFTGILGKLILLPSEHIVWYRMSIAAIGLLIMLPLLKVSFKLQHKKDLWKLIFVGIITALHWITFFKAISLSTASLGVLCLSTTTLHVAWLDPIIMKRRFSWIEAFFGLLVVFGIYFVSSDFSAKEYEALGYGLLSALLAGVFSVSNAKLVQTIPSPQITFYEMLTGAVLLTFILLFSGQLNLEVFLITPSDFWWLMFLGIVCTSIPFLLMIDIVKRLGAFTTSLSINLEPVYSILLAILILNENQHLGTQFYVGASLIIIVVLLNAYVKARMRRKRNEIQSAL